MTKITQDEIEARAEKDSLSDDLVSRLLDRQMAVAADYVRRGRSHHELNAAELVEAWKAAFRVYAREPGPGLQSALHDFEAELDIRGIAVPFAEVREDWDRLKASAATVYEELEADPERLRDFDEELRAEIAEFKARRDQSKQ
jgi:hypothetical protein